MAVIAGVVTVAGTAYGAYSSSQAAGAQEDAQQQQVAGQAALEAKKQKELKDLIKRLDLGRKPLPAEYQSLNLTEEQLESVLGNQSNLSAIQALLSGLNQGLREQDLNRIRGLIPGYDKLMKREGMAAGSLLSGRLPYEDVLNIVSDRASLSGSLGIPGAGGPATLKDLGMSRLGAIDKGAGLFKDMVNIAQQVSPIERYGKPTDFFISPQQRIQTQLQQRILEQQSLQNRYNIEAAPDPTKVGQQQLELAGILGQSGPLYAPPVQDPNYGGYAIQAAQALGQLGQTGAFGGGMGGGTAPVNYSGWTPGPQRGTYYTPPGYSLPA